MLRFFSKIRLKLAAENKPVKYMRYAIGEIVLVVIGILIALQVNNWNETRILKKQEKVLLAEIHTEFSYNRDELKGNLERIKQAHYSLKKIIQLFPVDLETTNYDSLAFYLEQSLFSGNFDYSNAALRKIQNATSAEIISNKELRNLLLQWDVALEDYLEVELKALDFHEKHYLPIINNHIPRPYKNGFKDPRADLYFLNSLEFENLVKMRARNISHILEAVDRKLYDKSIFQILDEIIELSAENE